MMKYIIALSILLVSDPGFCQESFFIFNYESGRNETRFSLGTSKSRTSSVSMGDVDGDGDIDIVVANGRHWAEANEVYLNSRGRFTTYFQLGKRFSTTYAAELADMDNDGDLDIIEGNELAPHRLYINDGKGEFEFHSEIGNISSARNIVLADLDQDKFIDIIICNRADKNMICYNQGDLSFQCENLNTERNATIDIEVSDLNNDSLPDLILANRNNIQNAIFLNKGNRVFEKAMDFGSGSYETRSVVSADVNNDGYKDIITGNINGENTIYLGSDSFDYKEVLLYGDKNEDTYAVAVADFNKDGLIDILAGNNRKPSAVFLNIDGKSFKRINLSVNGFRTYDVKTGDINLDGWTDIILANSDEYNFYLINNFKAVVSK